MDHLKEGIGLRGYGQKDPLIEYKKESFELFQDMMDRIEDETVRYLYFLQRQEESSRDGVPANVPHPEVWADDDDEEEPEGAEGILGGGPRAADAEVKAAQTSVIDFTRHIQRKKEKELAELQMVGQGTLEQKPVLAKKKAGRNDPCPCGSGKKYKKCHGA